MDESYSYHVLINAHSGAAAHLDSGAVDRAVIDSGLDVRSYSFVGGDEFFERLAEFSSKDEPILIGGGDGTICSAATLYLKNDGGAFGILPFGTMNMLARDLQIPTDLSQMFKSYRNVSSFGIDVGMVNDRSFLCAVGIGVMPQASKLREDMRDMPDLISLPKLGSFVLHGLDEGKRRSLKVILDGQKKHMRAGSVVVSNNQYAYSDFWDDNNFKRASLRDGVLGLYKAAPRSGWDKIRLLARLGFGDWKHDPAIKEYSGHAIKIDTIREKELVSIDGEPVEMETPLNFTILKHKLNLIVPKMEAA